MICSSSSARQWAENPMCLTFPWALSSRTNDHMSYSSKYLVRPSPRLCSR